MQSACDETSILLSLLCINYVRNSQFFFFSFLKNGGMANVLGVGYLVVLTNFDHAVLLCAFMFMHLAHISTMSCSLNNV